MEEKVKIILVDDEPEILELLHGFLKSEGYTVRCSQSGAAAVDMFKNESADLVVTDLRMPGMDGLEVLRAVKEIDSRVEVIVLTGFASIETAISALKTDGAFDFLTKPLDNWEDFLITIEQAVEKRKLKIENALLLEELSRQQINLETYNKELRQTKRALEISRYRYQDLYNQAPVGYLTLDPDGKIKDVNQTASNLFKMHKTDMQHKLISDFVEIEDRADFTSSHPGMASMPYANEAKMVKSDGDVFYAHLESLAILKSDGMVEQIRVTIFDISSQKQVERALIESEHRYRSFVENFKGITFRREADGLPAFYHGAVEETTGYGESDLVSNRPGWETLIHPDDLEGVRSRCKILLTSGDHSITHEYRIRHRDRNWRWVREHIQSLCDSAGRVLVLQGVIFDITDHKDLQTQYIESRKLDAIATMAAGIAHQFNNTLAGLMGNLELLKMDLNTDHAAKKYVDPMMELIENMTQLTGQLLAYARGGKYMPANISIHDAVRQSIQLIGHRLAERFVMNIQLSAEMDQVVADSTQLQVVLLAVLENAIEAMAGGGIITVQTHTVEMKTEMVKNGSLYKPGRYISLSINDSGCGMDSVTTKKLFDPFFTTKFIGRGLGLSAAYGIVVNHGGWMEVDTKVDQGTEMKIHLPLTKSHMISERLPESYQLSKGDATVLVVEDEEMVMKTISELLLRLEYRVLGAYTGKKALEVLRTHKRQIDVALLDVRLPDVDALDLYIKMLEIRPDLNVIVCSGYNKNEPVEKLLASGATAFLQKPFSVLQLSSALKSAIEGRADQHEHIENAPFRVL